MHKKEIKTLFYIEKNYSKIKELLKNFNESWSFNILGQINIYESDLKKAEEYFQKAGNIEGCAYCHFLSGNIKEADILLRIVKDSSPFVNWLLCLFGIINNKIEIYPTYFQIRNFYEQDLELLFKFKQYELIEQIIKKNNYLENFNREIYKYTGRVLYNNNYIQTAENLLKKSLEICYKDPETHYLLGELYIKKGQKESAIQSFKKSIEVNGEYIPALDRLKDLMN